VVFEAPCVVEFCVTSVTLMMMMTPMTMAVTRTGTCGGVRGVRAASSSSSSSSSSMVAVVVAPTRKGCERRARVTAVSRRRPGGAVVTTAKKNSGGGDFMPNIDADKLMSKYAGNAAKTALNAADKLARATKPQTYDGVFALLFINFALFVADHWAHLSFVKMLYLNHVHPVWWQFFTSTFCHASWEHLSSNIFFLYIFGKLVEEEEGAFGVWMSYLVTGIGANLASWLVLPKSAGGVLGIGANATVSLGASGAVFGLFAVSVLVKLKFNWKRILEVIILGQFVLERFYSEARMIANVGGVGSTGVNHVAHLAGALVGVLLIAVLNKTLPPMD